MIYLASPYSNDPEGNYSQMVEVCTRLMFHVPAPCIFSPVVHFHPIAQRVPYERMMEICINILQRSDTLCVVALPGWEESHGVQREVVAWMKPYIVVNPNTLTAIARQ